MASESSSSCATLSINVCSKLTQQRGSTELLDISLFQIWEYFFWTSSGFGL